MKRNRKGKRKKRKGQEGWAARKHKGSLGFLVIYYIICYNPHIKGFLLFSLSVFCLSVLQLLHIYAEIHDALSPKTIP